MPPAWASTVLTPKYATFPLTLVHLIVKSAASAGAEDEQSTTVGLIEHPVIRTLLPLGPAGRAGCAGPCGGAAVTVTVGVGIGIDGADGA
jgi:hypothetical protein